MEFLKVSIWQKLCQIVFQKEWDPELEVNMKASYTAMTCGYLNC